MTDRGRDVQVSDARTALELVLASSSFRSSERHRRFLSFIVEETLAGRADRIKAYAIATSAFGRDESFDPQSDSIVRIEAGRLRRALEHYYLTEGAGDPVRIEVPKGSYVPRFVHAVPDDHIKDIAEPPSETIRERHRGPRILVAPFDTESSPEAISGLDHALTRQIIVGLTRFSNLFVYGTATSCSQSVPADFDRLSDTFEVDFVLTGNVSIESGRLTVTMLLQEVPSGRFVWTESYQRDLDPTAIRSLRDEVADTIVRKLAQPYGVLYRRVLDDEGDAPKRFGTYRAVLEYYRFARTFDLERLPEVLSRLEGAVAEDPQFAEAFACLARALIDSMRFKADALDDPAGLLNRAKALARRAVELATNSSSAYHVLALAHWFAREVDDSVTAFRTALELNPNDTEVMADFGFRLAILMRWDEAIPLVEEAYLRNPGQPGTFRLALVCYHFMHARYADALREARLVGAPDVVYPHVMIAASAAELGRQAEARAAVAAVERLAPGYGARLVADHTARNVHPDLIVAILASLGKAGMSGLPRHDSLTQTRLKA